MWNVRSKKSATAPKRDYVIRLFPGFRLLSPNNSDTIPGDKAIVQPLPLGHRRLRMVTTVSSGSNTTSCTSTPTISTQFGISKLGIVCRFNDNLILTATEPVPSGHVFQVLCSKNPMVYVNNTLVRYSNDSSVYTPVAVLISGDIGDDAPLEKSLCALL